MTRAAYAQFLASLDALRRRAFLPSGWTIADNGDAVPPASSSALASDAPITGVTYIQAVGYAEAHGKRLPTEDEWERAAGGGDKEGRLFPWGESAAGKSWAFLGTDTKGPVSVDAFPDDVTPDGIVGLAGNVAEMVATQTDRREVPAKLPDGEVYVVLRGGSYRSRESDCQSAARWRIDVRKSEEYVGFRCVLDEAEFRRRFPR